MQIVLLFLFLILAVGISLFIMGMLLSAPGYQGPSSDHFDGTRFINPGAVKAKGGLEVFKWMLTRKAPKWEEDKNSTIGKRPLNHFNGGVRITFVNHSTFLIQVDGINILTDPVWSRRVSPYKKIGPSRKRAPGIRFEDLPRIDVVLLSHNHYDHLDVETMRMIFVSHHPAIIVPLGVKRYLDEQYVKGSEELDWWKATAVRAREGSQQLLTITAVPAQHFSGRGLFDRDRTLWCGYVIQSGAGNIYFSGDTGYNDQTFKEIGQRFGPMKVSMLPIGAYKPTWFMSPIHVSPEEAVCIHREVKSRNSIAMHFGTFPLADDGKDDPLKALLAAMGRENISRDEFIALKEGDHIVYE